MKPLPFLLFEALLLCLLGSPPRVVRVSSLKALLEGLLLLLVLPLQPGLQLLDALRCHCVTPFFARRRRVLVHRLRCCAMVSTSNCFSLSSNSFVGEGCSPLARASASSDSSAASSSSSERRASASLLGWSPLLFLLASMDSSLLSKLPTVGLPAAAVPGPRSGPPTRRFP